MFDQILEYDRELLVYLNNLGIERYDLFWQSITKTTFWIPLFLFFSYLIQKAWAHQKPWISQVTALTTFLVTISLTTLVKILVSRVRPSMDQEFSKLLRVLNESSSFSFFSGHAANSFAVTTIVVLLVQRRYPCAFLFYIWPVLFSFSRIYVGVHYPSDILAGILVGVTLGLLGYRFHKVWRSRLAASDAAK